MHSSPKRGHFIIRSRLREAKGTPLDPSGPPLRGGRLIDLSLRHGLQGTTTPQTDPPNDEGSERHGTKPVAGSTGSMDACERFRSNVAQLP